jgi:tRNA nucleotidyltransferase/poly(A) polymerase
MELVPGRPWRGLLFFAALYHDVGKPETRKVDEDGRIRFFGHDRLGAEMLGARARALHFSNQEIKRLKRVVCHHMRPHLLAGSGQPPSHRAVYRFFRDTHQAGVDICLLTLADVLATAGPTLSQFTWAAYLDILHRLLEAWWESPQKSVFPPPLVSGRELIEKLEVPPGPEIGRLLELIREAQVAGEVTTADQALEMAEKHAQLPST